MSSSAENVEMEEVDYTYKITLTKLQALSFYERNLDYSSKFYETQLQIKLYFKSMREDNINAGICATITLRQYTAHYRSPSSNGKESIKILF